MCVLTHQLPFVLFFGEHPSLSGIPRWVGRTSQKVNDAEGKTHSAAGEKCFFLVQPFPPASRPCLSWGKCVSTWRPQQPHTNRIGIVLAEIFGEDLNIGGYPRCTLERLWNSSYQTQCSVLPARTVRGPREGSGECRNFGDQASGFMGKQW